MPVVLSISSQVARGAVGNSAARVALERLGHEVWDLPTIVLSNHPGHPGYAGAAIEASVLGEMVDALEDNGWLGEVDAVLTGYMPSAAHVGVAARTVARVGKLRGDAFTLCDPALGDEPKGIYIDAEAAQAIREELLPRADLATPNRFELEWLTGQKADSCGAALKAAEALGVPCVLATSVPGETPGTLSNLLISARTTWRTTVRRRERAPHGAGDLMAALLLGHRLNGRDDAQALALSTAGVEAAIRASEGSDELRLIQSQDAWARPDPWPLD